MPFPFDPDAERKALAAHLAGDPSAMKSLVDRLACVPRLVASRNVRAGHPLSEDELKDVVQDAFVAIVRKLPKLEPLAPLESWLHGVCCMQFRVALRNKRRRAQRTTDLPDETVDPRDSEVAAMQIASEVQAVLARLGGVEADVIRMKHLDGMTFEELGAALRMSSNTVKAYYYRGLTALRRSLQTDTGGEEP